MIFKNSYPTALLLWGACTFQLVIVLGMIVYALVPLINGKSIVLPIQATDPRDLMRGNYVALQYSFSTISSKDIPNDLDSKKEYKYGDILWLTVKREGEVFKPSGIYTHKPDSGIYVKVIVNNSYLLQDSTGNKTLFLDLKAGIEEYYTTQVRAKLLETQIQKGDSFQALAFVKVAPSGNARLEKIEIRKIKK
ncbi:MAG: GDYXXLXY domain-containing protein [Bacteroidia bacterium]|nr:GDYXXLXY domain-containing protein [Bacteroidia bacterium]MDW8157439.1 GDYXXLXY domain-containing protein [Bacteroidia bacterium]